MTPTHTIVAELFTSQGCSSCPPADAVAARLAGEPGVIVISRAVTYWDRQGWRDTLGREENTQKQIAYAQALHSQIYTPQIVIDGRTQAVGSREQEVRALIRTAQSRPEAGRLTFARSSPSRVHVEATGVADARVLLIAITPLERVAIGSGENGGRHIDYTNVVRAEALLGETTHGRTGFDVDLHEEGAPEGHGRWLVIVQDGEAGPIHAAAFVPDD